MKDNINYLDLFSGIGGFHLGLTQAGFNVKNCYHSEIDKHANKIYEKHFNNSIGLGNVKTINPVSGKIRGEKINLITFGFPCQDLSVAGERKGFEGDRSSLFFEAIRLIKELQPNYFVFENVKGFFSSNGGKDFAIALRTITDIGYNGQWQLVNSRWFLPQNRERVFFVGYPRGKSRQQIFPIKTSEGIYNAKNKGKKKEVSPCLTTRGAKSRLGSDYLWVASPKRFANKRQNGEGINNKYCYTLTTQDRHGIFMNNDIREMTPVEWERLQGFPDNWTKDISDAQRYKCLGNAITVDVVREIFLKIK
tara:strand:+ start:917 stop:1837 length:921 start_codon:yes stop_codon:yes gene_type:complete